MIADLEKLARLIEKDGYLKETIRCETLSVIQDGPISYPILSFTVGSHDPTRPVLFLTGGFHGLERIGAQLAWSLLKTTVDRLIWDKALRDLFRCIRLVMVPLVNPSGYYNYTRSNARGVDLMRNSPIDATEDTPFLLGGHRYSSRLPWYRGERNQLEQENSALVSFFQKETKLSRCVVSLDFHSGFGMQDRLWFPFSYTSKPFDNLSEMHALTQLLEQTHPYHIYQIEPQSKGYLLSGDIWDYLYLDFKAQNKNATFLPMTLEMGSWTWVRKNPLQIFSRQGAFNPMKEHRVKRTYRRHHLLFDFLLKAINSHEVWANLDAGIRSKHGRRALEKWYR
jgi:hypothetical protein